jgi:hypothetical protein
VITLTINLEAIKKLDPKSVYCVTSTQWIDDSSKRIVDMYAVKNGCLLQCTVAESELGDYVIENNLEMGDGAIDSAIASAISASL